MKVTKFSALAALMLMAPVAQQAFALPPTTALNSTNDVVINLSGSSALQPVIGQFVTSVCNPGTGPADRLDVYLDGTAGASWRSYSCNLKASVITANGLPPNAKMLLNNRNKGGSVWGVIPVNAGDPVAYMNINPTNGGGCVEISPAGALPGTWNCPVVIPATTNFVAGECAPGAVFAPGNVVCQRSTAGISDVEPKMFIAPNLPLGFTPPLDNYAKLTQFSENGVIFGILVTENLYRELQIAQKVPGVTPISPMDWTPASQPSMKKTEVASILKGDLQNWLDVNKAWTSTGATTGAMAVCRRTPGSGTQAGANAYFMENMCRTASLRPGSLSMVTSGFSFPGYQVVENSATGNLLTCMNSAFTATNFGTADFLGTSHDAIGFAGIDILGGNPVRPVHTGATPDHFDFVKLDGVAPTVANAISGDYTFWYENTLQWPIAASGFGPNANNLAMLNQLQQTAANPATIVSAGLPGVAALPTPTRLWDTVGNFPTMRGTRNGNSCQDVILTKDNSISPP